MTRLFRRGSSDEEDEDDDEECDEDDDECSSSTSMSPQPLGNLKVHHRHRHHHHHHHNRCGDRPPETINMGGEPMERDDADDDQVNMGGGGGSADEFTMSAMMMPMMSPRAPLAPSGGDDATALSDDNDMQDDMNVKDHINFITNSSTNIVCNNNLMSSEGNVPSNNELVCDAIANNPINVQCGSGVDSEAYKLSDNQVSFHNYICRDDAVNNNPTISPIAGALTESSQVDLNQQIQRLFSTPITSASTMMSTFGTHHEPSPAFYSLQLSTSAEESFMISEKKSSGSCVAQLDGTASHKLLDASKGSPLLFYR